MLSENNATILAVDDTPANLKLLAGMLKEKGYKIRLATSGELALQAVANNPPDLILLDINMPDMNGFEVCEHLKAKENSRDIPVIFISALNETLDKVKAFGVGGVDYITKPFQFEEVEARVKTHLELQHKKKHLQESLEQMRQLERNRDSLVHMIVHDMRTPLFVISGYLELLTGDEARFVSSDQEIFQTMKAQSDVLIEMSSAILDVSRMEAGQMKLDMTNEDLLLTLRKVADGLTSLQGNRKLALVCPEPEVPFVCDHTIIARVVQNLVSNALKYTPDGGSIRIMIERKTEATVVVGVEDTGIGIPEEYLDKIFEKFGQVELREHKKKFSTGLGLTFCKMAVEAHGGKMSVTSKPGEGSCFEFELPIR